VPPAVTAVEVELPLATGPRSPRGRLAPALKETLADLADELAERRTPFTVKCARSRDDWPRLREWLADVVGLRREAAVVRSRATPRDRSRSSTATCSRPCTGSSTAGASSSAIAGDEARGADAVRPLLARLRHWQKLAADRAGDDRARAAGARPSAAARRGRGAPAPAGPAARLPPPRDRGVARAAGGAPRDFVRGARERVSLRLALLWLGCVFERSDVRPALRAIYESPAAAAALIEADQRRSPAPARGLARRLAEGARPREAAARRRAVRGRRRAAVAPAATAPRAVTVVIPSFNHERFVGAGDRQRARAVGGRAALRVLVVDDGSTDDTVAVDAPSQGPARDRAAQREEPRPRREPLRALRTITTPTSRS
jgi:hypothetical protein